MCIRDSNSGDAITTGDNNTAVGMDAADDITTGSNNVCIGKASGNGITTGDNNIYIGVANDTPVAGQDATIVIGYGLNGKAANTFYVGGSSGAYNEQNYSTWSTTSDSRIKKNIVDNSIGLDKINQIRVRNFEYRTEDEITELDHPKAAVVKKEGIQLGVIAQEIQEVLPDVVNEDSLGAYTVNPDNITWYLVNAVKELSAEIEQLKSQINN